MTQCALSRDDILHWEKNICQSILKVARPTPVSESINQSSDSVFQYIRYEVRHHAAENFQGENITALR
jgi:hypothetical protein